MAPRTLQIRPSSPRLNYAATKSGVVSTGVDPRPAGLHEPVLTKLRAGYVLGPPAPRGCVGVWRSAMGRVEQMSVNLDKITGSDWGISDESAFDSAAVMAMVERFREFNDRLGQYLGRDLFAWNKG